MRIYKGVCLSSGVAIGPAFRFSRNLLMIPDHTILPEEIETELQLLNNAVQKATSELQEIRSILEHHLDEEHAKMIDAQIMVLNDTELLNLVKDYMHKKNYNVILAYWEAMNAYENLLENSHREFQKQRLPDLQDVKRRVINHLLEKEYFAIPSIDRPAIFVSESVTPSDVINLYNQSALGIITKIGGRDSHAAILARAFRIPYISEVDQVGLILHSEEIILSADEEIIILDATPETRQKYFLQVQKFNRERQMSALRRKPIVSHDKVPISLYTNIGFLQEIKNIQDTTIAGIGLFRTEYLCLAHNALPSEEEQFETYKKALESLPNKIVTIRTFDFGRDKLLSILNLSPSWLGTSPITEGGIRFCLRNPHLLKTQFRALLRASIYGNLQVMFPLIFSCEDMLKALGILQKVKEELTAANIPFSPSIPIGAMIETTQILNELEDLAKIADFFSVGTNDLTIYLLRTKRQTDATIHYYHPELYHTIKYILEIAQKYNKKVTICGEMAADPLAALGLLALGVRALSVNPPSLYTIFNIIRKTTIHALTGLKDAILKADSPDAIKSLLENWSTSHHQ